MRLKTSKEADRILDEMHKSLKFSTKAALARLAIAFSLKISDNPLDETKYREYNSNGFEFQRPTLTGDKDDAIKAMILQHHGIYISDKDYYPKLIGSHIERGLEIIYSEFRTAGNRNKFFEFLLKKALKDSNES